jgi:hypothetical protein
MRKMGVIAAVVCAVCLAIPSKGGETSPRMAQRGPGLTAQDAISAARRNVQRPGSSFTFLREIVANADTRRVGVQALAEAQAHHIKLYRKGILADVLRSGGFLVAETEPKTNSVIALHLVSLGSDGAPKDAVYRCYPTARLADVQELAKDTTEFTEKLYSTPPSEATSLTSRFYDGRFPEYGGPEASDSTLFAVPRSLLQLGADPNEVREAAVLYGELGFWGFRYAVSMPAFAANPLVATQAAEEKCEALKAKFLRGNHMDPHFQFDPENIRSKDQLREQIDLLRRLDKFLEEALKNEAVPATVKANISVATIPLGVAQGGPYHQDGQAHYNCDTVSLLVIFWRRLPAGGFAVVAIGEAG